MLSVAKGMTNNVLPTDTQPLGLPLQSQSVLGSSVRPSQHQDSLDGYI
jgi:hypothetical protein